MSDVKNIDWANLGFTYIKTNKRFVAKWADGAWSDGELTEKNTIELSEAATVFHYGQAIFEGQKAFAQEGGGVALFRPDENAKRLNRSAERLMMPTYDVEQFVEACLEVVRANSEFVPPYGTGASLYIRPFMFGSGNTIGVRPSPEYTFMIFATPVGPYFTAGLTPIELITSTEHDRAAPLGTGSYKVAGNYAASMLPHQLAVDKGYTDCLYLDSKTHTLVDEVGAANFFGITEDNRFVTPKSESILPSITKQSVMQIARDEFGMTIEERDVPIDSLSEFTEAGACGTATVITPVGAITHEGKRHAFYADGKEVGPMSKKLYDALMGIQLGTRTGPDGWQRKLHACRGPLRAEDAMRSK